MIDEKVEELIVDRNWTRQPHGTSVGALHALLEGYQILPSDPEYGGNVKKSNVGVDSFPYADDNPSIHTRYAVVEETFND
eukprot:7725105-Pyramimonas_sp.AAC.1